MRKLKGKGAKVASDSDQSRNYSYMGRNPRLPDASGAGRNETYSGTINNILPSGARERRQEVRRSVEKYNPGASKSTIRKEVRSELKSAKTKWKAANPGMAYTKHNMRLKRD
jgi:hypothetical protein